MARIKPKSNQTLSLSGMSIFNTMRVQMVLIIIVSFLLYGKALKFGYNYLDDSILIIDNYKLNSDYRNIPKAFSQHIFKVDGQADRSHDYYRPLMTLSFMLDAHLAGSPAPYVYHFTNLILHMLTGILLLVFLKKMKIEPFPAFILCLFFLVHPALAQAVAWIPGRNDSLLALFVLSGFIFLIRFLEEKKTYLLILHFVMFLFSLYAKENGIMLVPLVFFYLKFIRKEKLTTDLKKRYAVLALGYFLCILPWWFMRQAALDANNSVYIGNVFKNIITNAPMISQYIGKTVLPFDLSVLPTIRDTHFVYGILTVLMVGAALFMTPSRRWNFIGFGLLWYFLFLFPALVSPFVGLEHRIYVPMFGFLLILAEIKWIREINPKDLKTMIFPFLILVFLGILTRERLPVFKDRISFYKNGIETSEYGTFAYLTLGIQYEKIEKYDSAIYVYQKGLKVDSSLVMFHNNIATDLMKLDRFPEAEQELYKELTLHPTNYTALQNLGTVYKLTNRMDKAAEQWKKVLQIKKNFYYANQELSKYYRAKGDTVSAKQYEIALMQNGN